MPTTRTISFAKFTEMSTLTLPLFDALADQVFWITIAPLLTKGRTALSLFTQKK